MAIQNVMIAGFGPFPYDDSIHKGLKLSEDAAANRVLKSDADGNAVWVDISAISGVTGPGASTDNAIARWDGAGGTALLNSGVVISDGNAVTGVVTLTTSGKVTVGGDLEVAQNIGVSGDADIIQLSAGQVDVNGDVTVKGGDVAGGVDGSVQGTLTLWDGAGGVTPAWILLHSPNGTGYYLFVEDDGTVKVHTSAPTQNSDGSEVGAQT